MKLLNGEIAASPKIIFSIDMSVRLHKDDLLDMLKRDVLVEEMDGIERNLEKLKSLADPYTGYILNLDWTLKNLHASPTALRIIYQDLVHSIKQLNPGRTLVLSSVINPEAANFFRSEGIGYIEKHIFDRRDLQTTILNIVPPFFAERNRLVRNFLRIYVENKKISIKIQNIHDGTSWGPGFEGIVQDISLNGLSVVFEKQHFAECFAEGDTVFSEFHFNTTPVRINRAIVSRVNLVKKVVCLYFDLQNPGMVNELNSTHVSQLFYSHIHRIISLKAGFT